MTLNQNISLESGQANVFRCSILNLMCIELKCPLISETFIALPCDGKAFNVNTVRIKNKKSKKRIEKDKSSMKKSITRDTKSSSEPFVK